MTSDTDFSNYFLIVDAYSKIPKLYGMEKITIEEVMDKLGIFQSRFSKIDQFGWWDLEIISAMQVRSLPQRSSNINVKLAEFV